MRTSSGVVRISSDVITELMHEDFPAPVAPAINTCGMDASWPLQHFLKCLDQGPPQGDERH